MAAIFFIFALALFTLLLCRWKAWRAYPPGTVGFLHAASGAGGGGERVLWVALDRLQRADIEKGISREYVVFTQSYTHCSGGTLDAQLLTLVSEQFHVTLSRPVRFVYLRRSMTRYLQGSMYPRLTILLQTFVGGMALFYEAAVVNSITPIVIETVGVPFAYPPLRVLSGCTVVSYTHYPVVSSSMRERLWGCQEPHVNLREHRHGKVFTVIKYIYYVLFAVFYRFLGQFPHVVFTNSSWTQAHIRQLFAPRSTIRLYAPCDVAALSTGSKSVYERNDDIVSVGQFRQEKNHMLQMRAFKSALPHLPPTASLVLVGGVRNEEDRCRVEELKASAVTLQIADRVQFRVNASCEEVHERLCTCCTGLHTMLDEHLGIVVLEYLAAGCIALAHRSGGVELDIINSDRIGFLARSEDEYADAMITISAMKQRDQSSYSQFQRLAGEHVKLFSDEVFGREFVCHLAHILYPRK